MSNRFQFFRSIPYSNLQCPFAPIRVPIIDWLPLYTKSEFFSDLVAGFTVFVLLIPQGLSYAVLAGMPPVYGLYTATFPCFVYTLLGSSKQLSMGPMAITSLLLGSSLHALGYDENINMDEYIRVTLNISMLAGIFLFIIGFLKLGVLVNFLSHSVLTGFITASALLISLSQLKYITGIQVPRYDYSLQTIAYLLTHLRECNAAALSIGISSWIILYMIKIWKRKNKVSNTSQLSIRILAILANMSSLIATLLAALVTFILYHNGITLQIVGYVPAGLLIPSFEFVDFNTILKLLSPSFILALIAFAGNWAVTKKFALIYEYEVNATQELIAEGLTNILGVLIANAFFVSGGLARSAVNAESGARTQISGSISAILIIVSLCTITSVFYYIPMAILGAIIEVSVASMIDFDEMKKAYYIDKKDFLVMVITFLATFFIGISQGIFIGVILSIVFVINPSAFPTIVHLGQLPDRQGAHFKDVNRFPDAKQLPYIAIIRMDASLYFANANHFKETIRRASNGDFHHLPSGICHNNNNNNNFHNNNINATIIDNNNNNNNNESDIELQQQQQQQGIYAYNSSPTRYNTHSSSSSSSISTPTLKRNNSNKKISLSHTKQLNKTTSPRLIYNDDSKYHSLAHTHDDDDDCRGVGEESEEKDNLQLNSQLQSPLTSTIHANTTNTTTIINNEKVSSDKISYSTVAGSSLRQRAIVHEKHKQSPSSFNNNNNNNNYITGDDIDHNNSNSNCNNNDSSSNGLPIKLVVIDASAWIDIDLCGMNTLIDIHTELLLLNVSLAFAYVKGNVRDKMDNLAFIRSSPDEYYFNTIHQAVLKLDGLNQIHKEQSVLEDMVRDVTDNHSKSPSTSSVWLNRFRRASDASQNTYSHTYSHKSNNADDTVANPLHFPHLHQPQPMRRNQHSISIHNHNDDDDNHDEKLNNCFDADCYTANAENEEIVNDKEYLVSIPTSISSSYFRRKSGSSPAAMVSFYKCPHPEYYPSPSPMMPTTAPVATVNNATVPVTTVGMSRSNSLQILHNPHMTSSLLYSTRSYDLPLHSTDIDIEGNDQNLLLHNFNNNSNSNNSNNNSQHNNNLDRKNVLSTMTNRNIWTYDI